MTNSTTILQKQIQFKEEEFALLKKEEKELRKQMNAKTPVKANGRVSLIAGRVTFNDNRARTRSLFQATFEKLNLNKDSNKFKKATKKFCKNSLKAQATTIVEDTTALGFGA